MFQAETIGKGWNLNFYFSRVIRGLEVLTGLKQSSDLSVDGSTCISLLSTHESMPKLNIKHCMKVTKEWGKAKNERSRDILAQ